MRILWEQLPSRKVTNTKLHKSRAAKMYETLRILSRRYLFKLLWNVLLETTLVVLFLTSAMIWSRSVEEYSKNFVFLVQTTKIFQTSSWWLNRNFFICVSGRNVTIPGEVIVLNSIVLPHKDLGQSYKNEIIL